MSVVLRTSIMLIVHHYLTVITSWLIHSQYVSLLKLQWNVRVVLMDIKVAGFIWSEEAEVSLSVAVRSPTIPLPYLELWLVSTTSSHFSSHYPLGDEAIASEVNVWKDLLLSTPPSYTINVLLQYHVPQRACV